jgi:catechol 2,3-dioxygenase-like lactoylglutathione lyase family enzyme
LYEGIDHLALGCSSVDAAAAPFERLGLKVSPPLRHGGSAGAFRLVVAGGPQNLFCILLAEVSGSMHAAMPPPGQPSVAEEQPGPPVFRLGLRVRSLASSLHELTQRGVQAESHDFLAGNGGKLGDIAPLPGSPAACANLTLVEYVQALEERYSSLERDGMLAHSLTLKRLDHVAAIAPDLEAATHYWNDTLGIPTWGEVVTPTTTIRQMRVGDAIVELLGPAGPDSPMRSRPPGLTGTVAFEVPDLAAAVLVGRSAGFTVSEPATGSLPGTRVARFAAAELSGFNLQLLQYV